MEKSKDLERGEQGIGVSGVLLFIAGFLPWYSIDFGGFIPDLTRNGWQSPGAFWSVLAILIGIAMVTLIVLQNFTGVGLPDKLGTLSWAQSYFIAGVVAFAFVLIKWLFNNDFVSFGLFLGLLFSAGLAAGGFLMYRGAARGETPQGPATPPPPSA